MFRGKLQVKNTIQKYNDKLQQLLKKAKEEQTKNQPLWQLTYLFMLFSVNQTVFLLRQSIRNNKWDKKRP